MILGEWYVFEVFVYIGQECPSETTIAVYQPPHQKSEAPFNLQLRLKPSAAAHASNSEPTLARLLIDD